VLAEAAKDFDSGLKRKAVVSIPPLCCRSEQGMGKATHLGKIDPHQMNIKYSCNAIVLSIGRSPL
jgi:hypothetical protein